MGKIILKPVGEKTRGIASLHYDIVTPGGGRYEMGDFFRPGHIVSTEMNYDLISLIYSFGNFPVICLKL